MNTCSTIGVCGTREPDDGVIISDGATSKIGGVVNTNRYFWRNIRGDVQAIGVQRVRAPLASTN